MWSWFQREILDSGRLPLAVCFAAYLVTFITTRTITRIIRSGRGPFKDNVSSSGLHIHHAVPGVILLVVGAFIALSVDLDSAWSIAAGVLVGVGTSLVLDEFALILHLEDVYWSEDGRTSVDAVFVAIAVAGLLVMGFNPLAFFDINVWREDTSWSVRAAVVGWAVLTLALAVVVLLKGKLWTGLVGMGLPPLLVVGAIRLSRPHAPWARWRYTTRPHTMQRAIERERRLQRPIVQANLWLQSVLAGMPRFPDDDTVDAQLDLQVHAAAAPAPVNAVTG
jgi:hypothetical protein